MKNHFVCLKAQKATDSVQISIKIRMANFWEAMNESCVKVSKPRKQFMVSLILPKKRTILTILSREDAKDSEFRSFLGRIEDTINCFRDLLTFNLNLKLAQQKKYISNAG